MGCACGKGNTATYTVSYPDGKTSTVTSLSQAIAVARRVGGTYAKNRR